jgi:hypothetical protein
MFHMYGVKKGFKYFKGTTILIKNTTLQKA